jgi:hypothetical protein
MTIKIPTKLIAALALLAALAAGAFAVAFGEDQVFSEATDTTQIEQRLSSVEAANSSLAGRATTLEGHTNAAPAVSKADLCQVAFIADEGLIVMLSSNNGKFPGDPTSATTFLKGAGLLSHETLNC